MSDQERMRERVLAGLQRARAQGKRLGRPLLSPSPVGVARTVREAATEWGVSKSTAARWIARRRLKGELAPVVALNVKA